jgi:hypothetical protein
MVFKPCAACLYVALASAAVPYGEAAAVTVCKPLFVLRLASEMDEVCVPIPTRQRTVAENARAPLLWTPGSFGPKTCAQGYVWREAFAGDTVCVVPAIRTETLQDNAAAPSRKQ